VCVYLVSVCVCLYWYVPGSFLYKLFGHENDVSCQRTRLRRSALGPTYPGTAPTRLRVCAQCRMSSQSGWALSEVSPRPGSRVAPSASLAMSYDVAAERGSQPAQRDELAHSQTVPIGDGVLPLTIDTPPKATTGILESLHHAPDAGTRPLFSLLFPS